MNKIKIMVFTLLAVIASTMYASAASAEGSSRHRADTWEFSLQFIDTSSAIINGEGGASVDINSDWGFGFGFGYNYTDQLQLGGTLSWSQRSYDATTVDSSNNLTNYSNYLDTSTFALNGVYYFMDKNITPFVSGGIGFTYIDTNIQDGPASGSCWYDPWWGYICNSYVPTKTQTDFSYNAGIGLRFELNRDFSIQASYNKIWIDISQATSTPEFDAWKIDFIFRI
jgi:opacity protein-like surface antigen